MRGFLLGAVAVLVFQGILGLAYMHSGLFAISAREPHTRFLWWVTETTKVSSIRRGASRLDAPPSLDDPELIAHGFELYRAHCVQCHGGPGVGPAPIGRGVYPPAPSLLPSSEHWHSAELFWIIDNGVKMSAMPAWHFSEDARDIWALVAFLEYLPQLSPEEFKALDQRAAIGGPGSIRRLPDDPEAAKPGKRPP